MKISLFNYTGQQILTFFFLQGLWQLILIEFGMLIPNLCLDLPHHIKFLSYLIFYVCLCLYAILCYLYTAMTLMGILLL